MNRLKGSLYGFIVGDVLGVPVEFMKREYFETHTVTDMIANAQRNTTIGYWSDDTAMTLCTLESINEFNDINYRDIMDKFRLWIKEGYMTAGDVCFGIGQRTLKALTFYNKELSNPSASKDLSDEEWIPLVGKLSESKYDSKTAGNGSLMRILPVVLYLNNSKKSLSDKINIISKVSSLTHANDECIASCIYYMFFIEHLLKTNNIVSSFKSAGKDLINNYDITTCENINRITNNNFLSLDISEVNTSGYVIDTLEASLWCLYNSKNYEDAVLKAVNLGGDTDTIAAITGSMAGLYYGYDNIPTKWIEKLIKKEIIDEKINEFILKL